MQNQCRWLQPEQEGPAASLWSTIWRCCSFTNNEMSSVEFLPLHCVPGVRHAGGLEEEHSIDTEVNISNPAKRRREGQVKISSRCSGRMTTPWQKSSYSSDLCGLHAEIQDFVQYMSPLPEEKEMRKELVSRISSIITEQWPFAKVDVFGSFRTGLYLPTSDIDMVIFGKWTSLPLYTLRDLLISTGVSDAEDTKVIESARVPIIKLSDKKTNIKVDISFNMTTGVSSALMIKEYMKEYSVMPQLVIVLKEFLLQRDLNEVFTGGLSSYSLILLVVSFLQCHPRKKVDSWDVNLGVLLIEFFELYGRNFHYENLGIRISNGGSYFDKSSLPENHHLANPSYLTIEDPLDETNDISRASWGAMKVKTAFEHAHSVLVGAVLNRDPPHILGSSILGRIIRIPEEVVASREAVVRKWSERAPASATCASVVSSYSSVLSSPPPTHAGGPFRPDQAGRSSTPEPGVSSEAQATGNQLTYADAAAGVGKAEVFATEGSKIPRSNSMSSCRHGESGGSGSSLSKASNLRNRCSSASSLSSSENTAAKDRDWSATGRLKKRPNHGDSQDRAGDSPDGRRSPSHGQKRTTASNVRSRPESGKSRIGKSQSPPGER